MKKLVVLDFGGQYAHLIATRIRHLGVYSEIRFPADAPTDLLDDVAGVILSGGPSSVYDSGPPRVRQASWLDVAVPVLGLCYGHQTIAMETGGNGSHRGEIHEFGAADLRTRRTPAPSSRAFPRPPACG
jgi:GMP synthase (glutamine-hydrolysing)